MLNHSSEYDKKIYQGFWKINVFPCKKYEGHMDTNINMFWCQLHTQTLDHQVLLVNLQYQILRNVLHGILGVISRISQGPVGNNPSIQPPPQYGTLNGTQDLLPR